MRVQLVLIGSVIMAFFVVQNAYGQNPSPQVASVSDRKAACELIEAMLQKDFQEKDAAEQIVQYQRTSDQVVKLCPTNILVTQALKKAVSKAADARDDRHAAKLLGDALREAQATLAFKPYIEAPLPEGFPVLTPAGEIQIKQYPKYRLARTQMAGTDTGAFWTLFTHIKKKDIAMTAPVEMTYEAGKDTLQPQSMAFLYRSVKQGQTGKDEKVEVVDVPATMALSFGMRGDVTKARLAEAKAHLDTWLRNNSSEYEASGPLRVMGYNSPFVAANRRFTEVQIPVRRTVKTGFRADALPLETLSREAVVAKLKSNGVNVLGLTLKPNDGGPAVNLGTGPNGGEANNANDENLRLIARLPEVERVYIYKGKFTMGGLNSLATMPKLRSLQIYASDVGPNAFAVLRELKNLEHLSIGEYPVTDEILGNAGAIRGLKSLDFTKNRSVTPAGFAKFLNAVESLESLTLFGDFVDDVCLERIGQMKGMKRLWTDSKRITPAGWANLAGLTRMEDLNLSSTSFNDEGIRSIEAMKDLKYLSLNKTQITDAGMTSLAGLVKLHDLGLESTKITDKGMTYLAAMTELQNLYVGSTEVTAKGLALVPRRDRMVMMRAGKAALSSKQFAELSSMFPQTQIFDPSGYWTAERAKAAMKELRNDMPMPKKQGKS